MSPHDCGQEKKQWCCEMEPSSRWGNWVRKWGSVWGHGIQTQQSEDFVFPTITYPPTLSCCHTQTHTGTNAHPPHLPVLYPPEVKAWYQPICFNHPHNLSSHSHHQPPSLPVPAQCVPQWNHSHTKTDCSNTRKGDWVEGVKWAEKRIAVEMKSCLDSTLTQMCVLTNPHAISSYTVHLEQR